MAESIYRIIENASLETIFLTSSVIVYTVFGVTRFYIGRRNTSKAVFYLFIIAPNLFLLMLLISEGSSPTPIFRSVFVVVAVFLPALLFYMFVTTKRESIFNTYVVILYRMGLLDRAYRVTAEIADEEVDRLETLACRHRRVRSYLDRFGAAYGNLSDIFVSQFLASIDEAERNETALELPMPVWETLFGLDLRTLLPVLTATLLLAIGWIATLPPGLQYTEYDAFGTDWYHFISLPSKTAASFAFLGAYFVSLQTLVKRFMRKDLGPNAYNYVSMRILLSFIAVWVLSSIYPAEDPDNSIVLKSIAFVMGAFPSTIWQLVSNSVKHVPKLSITVPSLETDKKLTMIDGLSVWHQARLEEEDVENVENFATADIIDLILSTRMAPNRIIDWLDQAILLTYINATNRTPENAESGANRDNAARVQNERSALLLTFLRNTGIRGATNFVAACANEQLYGSGPFQELGPVHKTRAMTIAAAICSCPNYSLVRNWNGTRPYNSLFRRGFVKPIAGSTTVRHGISGAGMRPHPSGTAAEPWSVKSDNPASGDGDTIPEAVRSRSDNGNLATSGAPLLRPDGANRD